MSYFIGRPRASSFHERDDWGNSSDGLRLPSGGGDSGEGLVDGTLDDDESWLGTRRACVELVEGDIARSLR